MQLGANTENPPLGRCTNELMVTRDRWAWNLHFGSDDARCLALAYSLHACAVLDGGSSPDAYSLHACAWVDLVVWRPLLFVVFLVVGKPKGIP